MEVRGTASDQRRRARYDRVICSSSAAPLRLASVPSGVPVSAPSAAASAPAVASAAAGGAAGSASAPFDGDGGGAAAGSGSSTTTPLPSSARRYNSGKPST